MREENPAQGHTERSGGLRTEPGEEAGEEQPAEKPVMYSEKQEEMQEG